MKLYNFEIIDKITAGYFPLPNNKFGNFFCKNGYLKSGKYSAINSEKS
jgi:hypothetical protein